MEVDIAPPALLQVMEQQCAIFPDDEAALDRLKLYLRRARPTWKEIALAVSEFYRIDPDVLISHLRTCETSLARQVFYYLVYKYTYLSLNQISKKFGHYDHTSVRHGVRKIEKFAVTRPLMQDDLDLLRLRICEKLIERPLRITPC